MSNNNETNTYDVVCLFSGGLDSIIAAKVLEEQGLRVKCLHFTSPFFGKPHLLSHWEKIYALDIVAVDVAQDFTDMIAAGPAHGFGKCMNPCVDCKILMATKAKELMHHYGAFCIASGEVLGQRPMSQRRDTLNIIRRDADVKDLLLRPLSAKRLDPTPMELDGRIDREQLLSIGGRGRKDQLALAEKYALPEIPTPAGGCLLAEIESSKRYWPVLKHSKHPLAEDFDLANIGRQYWSGPFWMALGRNQSDNGRMEQMARPGDYVFKTQHYPGPLGLGRPLDAGEWPADKIAEAAGLLASFSPKARKSGGPVTVRVMRPDLDGGETEFHVEVMPERPQSWQEPDWETVQEEKKEAATV